MTFGYILSSLLLITSLSCSQNISSTAPNSPIHFKADVIYGEDDRIEATQVTDPIVKAQKNSVAIIFDKRQTNITETSDGYEISDFLPILCESERFHTQNSFALCTGFLVETNQSSKGFLTAGHCISDPIDCENALIIFDYDETSILSIGTNKVAKSSVFECGQLLKHKLENTAEDYSFIELKQKPPAFRKPLTYRKSVQTPVGEALYTLGHPIGMPMKYSDGAYIRAETSLDFTANLDTMTGASGSPVLSKKDHSVLGMLIDGETDLNFAGCATSNQCTDAGCTGETSLKLSYIDSILNPTDNETPSKGATTLQARYTQADLNIPDQNFHGVASSLDLSKQPPNTWPLIDILISHEDAKDLMIGLITPSQRSVILKDYGEGDMLDLIGPYDENSLTSPQQDLLMSLSSEPPGPWTLVVADLKADNVGRLIQWSIQFVEANYEPKNQYIKLEKRDHAP